MRGCERQTSSSPASSNKHQELKVLGGVPVASEDECLCGREWNSAEATLLQLETMTEDRGEICLATHPNFQLHIEPAVQRTFFQMPWISLKRNDKHKGPDLSGDLSQK